MAMFNDHRLKDVEAIHNAHYLGHDIQLAQAAALKLEARKNRKMSCKMVRGLCGGYAAGFLKSLVGPIGLEPGNR
jgi:hypothetical protein